VVFGKINSTAINLSSIAAGTGGFVINGDHGNGYSGRSVSSACDVDGDGRPNHYDFYLRKYPRH
jgi:hypothetical protein